LFKLSLEEIGIVTVCEISTMFEDEDSAHVIIDFNIQIQHSHDYYYLLHVFMSTKREEDYLQAFRSSQEICQIILKSEALKEAVQGNKGDHLF
jgi:hypothetical protein